MYPTSGGSKLICQHTQAARAVATDIRNAIVAVPNSLMPLQIPFLFEECRGPQQIHQRNLISSAYVAQNASTGLLLFKFSQPLFNSWVM